MVLRLLVANLLLVGGQKGRWWRSLRRGQVRFVLSAAKIQVLLLLLLIQMTVFTLLLLTAVVLVSR